MRNLFESYHLRMLSRTTVPMNISTLASAASNGTMSDRVPFHLQPQLDKAARICFTLAYLTIFMFSFVGNTLIIHIIRKFPPLRTTTNILLVNLACCDLVTTLLSYSKNMANLYIGQRWFEGSFAYVLCKISQYSSNCTVTCAIMNLMLITIDRFYSVVRPTKATPISRHKKKLIVLCWVVACALPFQTLRSITNEKLYDGKYYCFFKSMITLKVLWQYALFKTFISFLLPLGLMCCLYSIICYKLWFRKTVASNQRRDQALNRRVTKAMVAIVTMFIICWLPQEGVAYRLFFHGYPTEYSILVLSYFTTWLWNCSSAFNPWLYAVNNRAIRSKFARALSVVPGCGCLVKLHTGEVGDSSTRGSVDTWVTRRRELPSIEEQQN